MAKNKSRLTLRTEIISNIEKALSEQPTNVAVKDSEDKKLIYDLAEYFRTQNEKYDVKVGPYNNRFCLIVTRRGGD